MRRFAVCVNFRSRLSVKIWSNIYLRCYDSTGSSHVAYIGLFLTTYAVIGIHRVIFVMEIRTSSIDECNFRICTAVSVFWLNSMRYCGFCTFFCAVLRLSDPLYAPLLPKSIDHRVNHRQPKLRM